MAEETLGIDNAVHSERGSEWHRWDPHIHTPGTVLNDQYRGEDPWGAFLSKVEASDPAIRALGITDYFGIDPYEKVLEFKRQGRLPNVGLLFPNVELRLNIETNRGAALNLHLLFSPDEPDHCDRIRRFLLEFEFPYQGENFRCHREDLIRLGKKHKPEQTDPETARSIGANQFKVSLEQLKTAVGKHEWVKRNALIAVAGGQKDGTSGLRDSADSWAAQRKNIEQLAHIIFDSNPRQVSFWLGQGALSVHELDEQYNGRKPCLHGSDAHTTDTVGVPDQQRRCWIKGDLAFESLRQTCLEPEERVFIGAEPRRGSLQSHTIESLTVVGAPWLKKATIPLNAGLVAVVGARGSGKTALADLVAAGGYGLSPHLNKESFVFRAKQHLDNCKAQLTWENGETTGNEVSHAGVDDLLYSPHVQYLSQQFVNKLCSAEDASNPLNAEIERVIFSAHPRDERMGASTFQELLELRLEGTRQKRRRHQETLRKASTDLTEERTRKASLAGLSKDRAEKAKAIEQDKRDRKSLIPKGNEERAKRLEDVSQAAEQKRLQVERAKRRHQMLLSLKGDVEDFRIRRAPELLDEMQQERADTGLSDAEWDAFKLDFVGDVDALLADWVRQVKALVGKLQGPSDLDPVIDEGVDPNVPLIPEGAELQLQTLSLLDREVARLNLLVGADKTKVKRYSALTDKITKAENALVKLDEQIKRAQEADAKIRDLIQLRRTAYAGVFEAIVEEEEELKQLYAPIQQRIAADTGSMARLAFTVKRNVDIEGWSEAGEGLLDLRTGPFRGRGQVLLAAKGTLMSAWQTGSSDEAATALLEFVKANEENLRAHQPDNLEFREWARRISDWLYSTEHITVGYSLQYDEVEIEQLSPGTRGIVLLLLYLSIDAEDDRPLIIDQPEENLDPQSVFEELVTRFREARKRRQIIIVTHNANLVVNTDADQVIVASCGRHRLGQLPEITYECGGLENPRIRRRVCEILEGGERAFKERARRLRVAL
ncbi:TrlF family AAA-like ATPase [Burkholderia sp. Ac-20353]|uniref:TrlF family AAA-like ATPase n=1 Tax=Burkholderia sp. Ac-20353 TaxID=2703894 RepID=UPI00197C64A8|nr:AAA family ATPase [Burkholderia sp. Ac-20353]MBN3790101.1 AAA family ATPase [Burkholderia sp. Ac-20353]